MECNDSPEIPDKGETSDIPGLPSRVTGWGAKNNKFIIIMLLLLLLLLLSLLLLLNIGLQR